MLGFDHGNTPSTSVEEMSDATRSVVYANFLSLQGSLSRLALAGQRIGNHTVVDGKSYALQYGHGFAYTETGLIVALGDSDDVNPVIVQDPAFESFRIASGAHFPNGPRGDFETKLLGLWTAEDFSAEAVEAMLGAIMLYNQAQSEL